MGAAPWNGGLNTFPYTGKCTNEQAADGSIYIDSWTLVGQSLSFTLHASSPEPRPQPTARELPP